MYRLALFTAMLVGTSAAFAQNPVPEAGRVTERAVENDSGAVYGKIKEVKDKQKIVIAVEKGRDRTFNLADAKVAVALAEGLAVGDKVKVLETKKDGAQSVQIVRDVREQSEQRSRQK